MVDIVNTSIATKIIFVAFWGGGLRYQVCDALYLCVQLVVDVAKVP